MLNVVKDARFMRNTGLVLLLLTVAAFTPKYFGPLLTGSYTPPSQFMHPHAVTALLWTLIFVGQPWLIATGRRSLHRTVGCGALVVAVANIVSGIAVQLDSLPTSEDDYSNIVGGGFRLFHSVPAFTLFLIAAIRMRKRTDWHLRFMYQTAIAAVATVLGRILVFYGDLPEDIAGPLIPLGNLAFVLLLPAYDYLTYRKVHKASWIGVAAFFVFQAIATPIVFSDFWTDYATGQLTDGELTRP